MGAFAAERGVRRTLPITPMISRIRRWLLGYMLQKLTHRCRVHGFDTVIVNTRPDVDSIAVVARLDAALTMLHHYVPLHYRRFARDIGGFLVDRRANRGMFLPETRQCVVELTFSVNPQFSVSQVAAVILHEAMHARLHTLGKYLDPSNEVRHEQFCRRAEIAFGQVVPDGALVVARAQSIYDELSEMAHEQPEPIDRALAQRRVLKADINAMDMPAWYRRRLARRHGLDLDDDSAA
jgi:hypothetical protein